MQDKTFFTSWSSRGLRATLLLELLLLMYRFVPGFHSFPWFRYMDATNVTGTAHCRKKIRKRNSPAEMSEN